MWLFFTQIFGTIAKDSIREQETPMTFVNKNFLEQVTSENHTIALCLLNKWFPGLVT
jgi:hypothetical protein